MTHLISSLILTIVLTLTFPVSAVPEDTTSFSLGLLAGCWEGNGEVIIPKTSIPISIEGKAVFSYDSTRKRLRTSLEASRFFFSYADSGYLSHNPDTDSITWEVWDSFGKYSEYTGKLENNVIHGARHKGSKAYNILISLITRDSLSFSLTTTYENGKTLRKAAIDMWRIE